MCVECTPCPVSGGECCRHVASWCRQSLFLLLIFFSSLFSLAQNHQSAQEPHGDQVRGPLPRSQSSFLFVWFERSSDAVSFPSALALRFSPPVPTRRGRGPARGSAAWAKDVVAAAPSRVLSRQLRPLWVALTGPRQCREGCEDERCPFRSSRTRKRFQMCSDHSCFHRAPTSLKTAL